MTGATDRLHGTKAWFAAAVLALVAGVTGPPAADAAGSRLALQPSLDEIRRYGELRVGFEVGFMPFQMIDQRGGLRERQLPRADLRRGAQRVSFVGFDVDIAREMAKELGVRFVPVNMAFPNLITALNARKLDIIISGMSITEARKERVAFADPYMSAGQTILLHKRHAGVVTSYKDLDDPKFTVASRPGTTGAAAVRSLIPNCTFKPFDTEASAAVALLAGKVDAFVYDRPHNAVFYAMHKDQNLVFLDKPFTSEQLAWAIRKDDPEFLKWLNGFLAKIKADGRYDAIYNKWFNRTHWFAHVR
ncbi:MAG: transporter substrate-binding domain-containing protein [Alphaproteobacteria bacterium]|nr:transporter substrate-binding domain-containing protein [Alphaproteobacteria bacterium]